ncbi:MAG: hypothetical protein ACLGJB_03370 [Blastocatellia bacterium]
MGRFARSQSGALSGKAPRHTAGPARPRFSTDPQIRARDSRIKSQPVSQSVSFTKPDKPAARPARLNRRARKRIKLITLAILSLVALGAGWMLGETVMGPSPADHSQPAISVPSASEAKSATKTAAATELEAKAAEAQEPESISQDADGREGIEVKDEKRRPTRKAAYSSPSRREFASPNARRGPGIGAVTGPIKAVFKPLKRANPLRLRIW